MSTPWRITRGDFQFAAKDVAELKLLAATGKIQPGDLVQGPGRTDWLYAAEVAELTGLIKADDAMPRRKGPSKAMGRIIALVTVGILGGTSYAIYWMYANRPSLDDIPLFGDQPGQMGPLDALATESAVLLEKPDGNSSHKGEIEKDCKVSLIRRLGDYYEVTTDAGATGWLGTMQVIPGYKFSQEMSDKYDPLFNPDRYLNLVNYAWTPVDEPGKPKTLTTLMFELENPTDYPVAGVMLKVTFKDGNGAVIDTKNIEVPRLLSANDTLFVSGIEIDIAWDENTKAEVDIFGARTLLPDEYRKLKAEEDARLAAEAEAEKNKK